MKINQIFIAAALSVLLAACIHDHMDQDADQPKEEAVHLSWPSLPLVALGEHVYIRLPDSLLQRCELNWNHNFGRLEVMAGPQVDMIIMETLEDVDYRKFELERGIFNIEYLHEEADGIIYKASLPDGSSAYYHFYMTFTLGERRFQVENNPLVEFNEESITLMSLLAGTIIDKSE